MNKTGNYMLMDPNSNLVIEDIESYEIYLLNFNKLCYDKSEVDVSLQLFSAKSYEEMKKLTNNPIDILVIKELEKLAMEEEWVYAYDQEIVRKKTENSIKKESYEHGIEEGMELGSKEKQLEIAKSMLDKDMDINLIIELTGLTKNEINKINN